MQITDRDRALLAFAAEHRFVTAGQVSVLLDVTEAAADARLRALAGGGYLRRERKLHREPPSHQISRDGLRVIGSDLPTPRKLDLATYHHDAGLAWLMLAARRGRFGPVREVVSERRMRSHDGRTQDRAARYGVRLGGLGPGGRERLHYPDMVLLTASGHRVAFELELSSKSADRRERIIGAYAADRRIDAVAYLVDQPRVGRAIERSAARVGVSDMVIVQNATVGGSKRPAAGAQAAERIQRRAAAHGAPAAGSAR